jgi:hypothetical protein
MGLARLSDSLGYLSSDTYVEDALPPADAHAVSADHSQNIYIGGIAFAAFPTVNPVQSCTTSNQNGGGFIPAIDAVRRVGIFQQRPRCGVHFASKTPATFA